MGQQARTHGRSCLTGGKTSLEGGAALGWAGGEVGGSMPGSLQDLIRRAITNLDLVLMTPKSLPTNSCRSVNHRQVSKDTQGRASHQESPTISSLGKSDTSSSALISILKVNKALEATIGTVLKH